MTLLSVNAHFNGTCHMCLTFRACIRQTPARLRHPSIRRASTGRIKDITARAGVRPLDEAQRARAKRRQLDALERDNHDDQFDAAAEAALAQENDADDEVYQGVDKKKKKKPNASRTLAKTGPRTLEQFLSEHALVADSFAAGVPNYFSAAAAPSQYPARPFCSVCGFMSKYACMRCGHKVCGARCEATHHETRCK